MSAFGAGFDFCLDAKSKRVKTSSVKKEKVQKKKEEEKRKVSSYSNKTDSSNNNSKKSNNESNNNQVATGLAVPVNLITLMDNLLSSHCLVAPSSIE